MNKWFYDGVAAARYDVETRGYPHATQEQTRCPNDLSDWDRIEWYYGYNSYFENEDAYFGRK
jgi:hypothetical protein